MKIQCIVAHPRPSSFCHSIFSRASAALERDGHTLIAHDLYDEQFDPVLKADEAYTAGNSIEQALSKAKDPIVSLHRKEIMKAEGLLIAHPNWWGKPPAILAGWLDRVLVPGVAYRLHSAEGEPEGLLSLRSALVLNTSDTPRERETDILGDPLNLIWKNCVLPYCGVNDVMRRMFGPVAGSSADQRDRWLDEVETLSSKCFGAAD